MNFISSGGAGGGAGGRRRLTAAVRESLRALSIQLALLNRQVGEHLELKDAGCLDLISRFGPVSPSALARRAGLHPATLTGILDRLERSGFIARERACADRRGVRVRMLPDRTAELLGLYAPMNSAVDQICSGYSEAELGLLSDFLRRATDAGQSATDQLSGTAGSPAGETRRPARAGDPPAAGATAG
jgi:DNA-binding MarR family transcriptional regulator